MSVQNHLLWIEKLKTEAIKKWRFQSNYPSSSDEQPMNKALNSQCNSKKSEQEFEVRYGQRGRLRRGRRLLVYDTFEAHVTENAKAVFAKENSNSLQIDLSSLTHSVPWVVEELDAVDSERYPWFYSGWPPKESIGRTDRFVAGAWSDIIFWRDDPIVVFWVFPNHDVFTLIFFS